MGQNKSHAVMSQRQDADDLLDLFPTPPWATRALVEEVLLRIGLKGGQLKTMTAHDPASGLMHMVRPLREYFKHVYASDCHDYETGAEIADFLMPGKPLVKPDWTIVNPPFIHAAAFIHRALQVSKIGAAVLVRTSFIEGRERYHAIFKNNAPAVVAQFVERVPMVKGRYDPWASTATSYCWMVFKKTETPGSRVTKLIWIPPCRKKLEKKDTDMDALDKADRKGYLARKDGLSKDACPYEDKRTRKGAIIWSRSFRRAWFNGWERAEKELNKK